MKYFLVFTLPSGSEFVASAHDGKLAMVPVSAHGSFRGAMSWDTHEKVAEFLAALKESIGQENFDKLLELKPRAVRGTVAH